MPRIKRGVTANRRHKKVLKEAKGHRGAHAGRRADRRGGRRQPQGRAQRGRGGGEQGAGRPRRRVAAQHSARARAARSRFKLMY